MTPEGSVRIAFTGHRSARLARSDTRGLVGRIDEVFTILEDRAARRPVLVTALADGADQLAAQVALKRGWSLDVILPEPVDRFCANLPTLADQNACRYFAAHAARVSEHETPPSSPDYLAAGLALLDQASALVAVLDGGPSGGSGGATDLVERARALGIEVLVVPAGSAGQ